MKFTVKLFGTLSRPFPDYQPAQGLEMEMPEGSQVDDLLTFLKISDAQGATVVMNGRFLSRGDKLTDGSMIQIFQALHGG